MKKIVVENKFNNYKLDNFVFHYFPNLNKNTFFKALRNKDIKINEKRIHENILIHTNDIIYLYISDEKLTGISDIIPIYNDDNILILNKPNGISVDRNSDTIITYTDIIKSLFGDNLEPCHRLDSNTEGLLIFSKNSESNKILLEKFKNSEIEKHYLAYVYGIPFESHKILEAFLFKDRKKNIVYISDTYKKGYSKIITEYTMLSKDQKNNISILDINLHTGKTHQIRAHLAHFGYPIIGDGKYGNNKINKKFNKKIQMLCSYKIKFNFSTPSGILTYLDKKEVCIEVKFKNL